VVSGGKLRTLSSAFANVTTKPLIARTKIAVPATHAIYVSSFLMSLLQLEQQVYRFIRFSKSDNSESLRFPQSKSISSATHPQGLERPALRIYFVAGCAIRVASSLSRPVIVGGQHFGRQGGSKRRIAKSTNERLCAVECRTLRLTKVQSTPECPGMAANF